MKSRFPLVALASIVLFAFALITTSHLTQAQTSAQSGTISVAASVVDSLTRSPVTGARVELLRADKTIITGTIADKNGFFVLKGVPPGQHTLFLQSVGFLPKYSAITIPAALIGKMDTLRLPPQRMTTSAVKTGEVEVSTTALRAEVRGDTTEFNAKAFKTDKNAAAEDLVRKMPGVEVDASGTVKAQGENVTRVLVDGKPFFGDDPTAALRNLPSDIIDKVQVIDQMSDQAAFTRFDDGNRTKALNIITNPNRRNGMFGKFYGGYGSSTAQFDSRYNVGGNLNMFNGDRKISILGMSNNINQQNFAIQDILGLLGGGNNNMMRMMGNPGAAAAMRSAGGGGQMFRGGGGGGGGSNPGDFLVPQSDGITAATGLGLNYTDSWGKNVTATASYFVNYTDNNAQQDLSRQFFLADGVPPQNSTQGNISLTNNLNHRVNMRIEATLDSANSFVFTPRLTVQTNNRSTATLRSTFVETMPGVSSLLNNTNSQNASNNLGYTVAGDLLWRHKFPTDGRTLSLNLSPSYNHNDGSQTNNSINGFASPTQDTALLYNNVRQRTPVLGNTLSLGGNVTYTEPLLEKGMLQASYNVNWAASESDRKVFDYSTSSGEYTQPNVLLSNVFTSTYVTHRPGLSYRYLLSSAANFSVGLDYQAAFLNVSQQSPSQYQTSNTFTNVLPSANLTVRFDKTANLRFNYRASTNAPGISQLQNVLNNSDPLRLSIGNPTLQQEYTHSISANFGAFDVATANSMFFFVGLNFTQNKIVNATTIASRDTLILPEVRLGTGGQFTRPTNVDGYWTARAFGTYSFPWEVWKGAKLNINVGAGLSYTRDLSIINGTQNNVDNYSATPTLTVSSNISENLDFTVSGRSSVSVARNSLQSSLDNTFLVHTVYGKLNWVFWEGFLLSGELNYISNNGLSSGFNQSVPLVTVGLGKRFLDDKLEFKLSVFDALNLNTAIARNITSTYIEDSQTVVLRRYAMLTVTYNLRAFGGGL